eukprot:CAMPEP_0182589476 /NCGR_PEP_ID=MMETSP1324-20130603/69634_1 /TAXON_ID=236786 /ORGANISM="Florenciella sp., Strain RCC1587" /LENGTH=212 /DNA_ID=CAMNT_0024806615 /DNA_START=11 /DNA_END=649 /DNA_ORIENTATION=+
MAALVEGEQPLIAVTARLREATELVNGVSVQKFPILLTRIIAKLHLRNEHIFSEAEQEQLCGLFALSTSQLTTVLESCSYILEQAAYHTIHPNALKQLLEDAGMDEEHAQAVSTVWADEATEFVGRLKEHTMSGPKALLDSQYRLHLMMGESNLTRLKEPSALFEFKLGRPEAGPQGQNTDKEDVVVEFSHSELYDLFQQLEHVQEQLDSLS